MKWIIRIVLSLLGVILVSVLLVGGVIAYDANFGAVASDYTNMTYQTADGTEIDAFLATPEEESVYPAVIMVHEWWGINGEITELAEALAEEGYVVLAPDTYRGNTTSLIPRALYLRLTVDEARVDDDLQAAYDYLLTLDNVDAENIGVMGFCYGGGIALQHGISNPEIDAVINLYGTTPSDVSAFGALTDEDAPPVLGIFGADDQMIPVDEVNAFEQAMTDAGISNTVTIYDGVGHAFVQPDVINDEGQAREAWLQIIEFLNTNLKDDTASS